MLELKGVFIVISVWISLKKNGCFQTRRAEDSDFLFTKISAMFALDNYTMTISQYYIEKNYSQALPLLAEVK